VTSICFRNARQQVEAEQARQDQLQRQEELKAKDNKRFWYLAVISLVLIPYWIIYHQMLTTFPFQAVHMRMEVGNFQVGVSKNVASVSGA
jgi:dipeptide/tripeptide permease